MAKKNNTPQQRELFDAIVNCDVESVRKRVQRDPGLLEAFDYSFYGATPVTRCCFLDNRQIMETLIELGADVNRRSDWSMGPWSPLHSAVINRKPDLANFLLDNGATLDVHGAAGLGRIDDLTRLLDESPQRASELGGDGCQSLHFADSPEVAKLLVDRGADMEARCIDHYSTPVQYLASSRPEVPVTCFQSAPSQMFFRRSWTTTLRYFKN